MLYFTSDCHFNHNRDFIYEPRGFNSVEESNNTIITNWNNTVTDEDEIYVIGDFFLGSDEEFVRETLANLKGNIHLIRGNHDTDRKVEIYKEYGIETLYADVLKYHKRRFYMSHYPTLTANYDSSPWNCVINLFGHTHSKEKFYNEQPFMYNVACDAHNCTPVSIEEIIADIRPKLSEYFDRKEISYGRKE